MSTPAGGALLEVSPNPDSPEYRLAELERKFDILLWLHAEQAHQQLAIATTVAALLTQQIQPQVQQALLNQILSG